MWSAKMKRMKGRNEPPPLILELLSALATLDVAMKPKLLAPKSSRQWKDLTVEERRERRRLRREKQREDNLGRAKKMHVARLKMNKEGLDRPPELEAVLHVGCSGWRYWRWRDSFYAGVPQPDWFEHYLKDFDTVEINASFYSWPTVAGVRAWRRQPGDKKFVYTVKVCELITHVKRFKGTKTLIKDFGLIADILGEQMGCFLFQLPPSYRYSPARLDGIVSQLDPARRNVVEFSTRAGGMKTSTRPSAKRALSSAHAAAQAFPMTSSGPRARCMSACTAPNAGIVTITRMMNSTHGPTKSRRAAPNAPGSISIMIMMPTRRRTR